MISRIWEQQDILEINKYKPSLQKWRRGSPESLNDQFEVSRVKHLLVSTVALQYFYSKFCTLCVFENTNIICIISQKNQLSLLSENKKECVTSYKLCSTVSKIKLECVFCIWQHENESVSACILIIIVVDGLCVLFKALVCFILFVLHSSPLR